jgi:hypothetical protein
MCDTLGQAFLLLRKPALKRWLQSGVGLLIRGMITAKQMLLDGSAEETPAKDEFSLYLELIAAEGGLMTAAQASAVLGVSQPTVLSLAKRGKVQSWPFWGQRMVSVRDIQHRLVSPRDKGGRPRLGDK